MSKPIVAEVTKQHDDFPKGATLGFESEADAKRVLGDGAYKVIGHQDGSVYEAPKQAAAKSDAKADKDQT